MTIRYNIIFPIMAAFLFGVALSSCSSDGVASQEPDGVDEKVTVTFNIKAAPLGNPVTRANFEDSELTETSAGANELINNWVVAFFRIKADGNKEVVAIVDGTPGTGGTSASGVWNDRVKLELPRGTYSALAFANFDMSRIKEHIGEILADSDWKNHVYEVGFAASDNSLIPMSGYLENFTVRGTVNEEFAIEVVRMMAKIEFTVKSLSEQKVAVTNFLFKPVYTGSIYLFPEYDKKPVPDTQNPTNPPRIPAPEEGVTLSYGDKDEIAPSRFVFESSSKVERANFYIRETIAAGNHPTDRFHIGLRLKRGEEPVEDVTYALADEQLQFIYRNDYILFPIIISDYVPEFEVLDYPPIGGYPVSVEAVNNEFYATFSSSGAFDISARLRDSQNHTIVIQPETDDNQENYVNYLGAVDSDGNSVEFPLTYEPTLATWQGNFQQGDNRHITLKFEFKIGSLIYNRTLHLISN